MLVLVLSARPTVSFPAAEHLHPLANTKSYCLVTETRMREQLVNSHYMKVE